ncbi:MAG: peptidoglycan-binding protein [Candidatus Competibacteraceae bacterium]
MAITDPVSIPANINPGLSSAKQQTMITLIGNPRNGNYDNVCRPVTNPKVSRLIVTDSVGPFRVTGLRPAIASLKEVIADIKKNEPQIFAALGTAGMLCARLVRNSTTAISNHSWGTAIDLTLNGQLDVRGDGRVQVGLASIAPIFNRHGWFWGAGFRTEDGMHFEASDEKIRQWHREGQLGSTAQSQPESALSLGDRGPEVVKLQQRLNELGADLAVDGKMGRFTVAAVMEFQADHGLTADGIVGSKTLAALGLTP